MYGMHCFVVFYFQWTFLLPATELLHGTVDDQMSCCLLDCCPVCKLFSIRLFVDMLCFCHFDLNWD